MEITINRIRTSDHGTEGLLIVPLLGFTCRTLELPWRNNQRGRSCIPAGEYPCALVNSPKYKSIYHIKDVPSRSHILIHSGNFAGDVEKGFKTHVEGCILLGKKAGELSGQRAVLTSRPTVRRFMERLHGMPFTLTINGGY